MIFSIMKASESLAVLRNHIEEEDRILSAICITPTTITNIDLIRLKDISMGMILYRTYNEKGSFLVFVFLKEKQLRNSSLKNSLSF